jgi:N6-adenosine-specific RNA methylase IME4
MQKPTFKLFIDLEGKTPHSVKPDYFYKMVENQSEGPYLELFARRNRINWSVWGNEVESDLSLEVNQSTPDDQILT